MPLKLFLHVVIMQATPTLSLQPDLLKWSCAFYAYNNKGRQLIKLNIQQAGQWQFIWF